jgi:hypothetical protein
MWSRANTDRPPRTGPAFRTDTAFVHARLTASSSWASCVIAAVAAVAVVALSASPALAQFRNHGVQLPNAGWLALGTSTDGINDSLGIAAWNATDQGTLGAGYFGAIGYNAWTDTQVAIGFGVDADARSTATARVPVFSLAVSTGLRLNLLDMEHRPFVSAHIQYLHLIPGGAVNLPRNDVLAGQHFWVGPRLGAGYEYFFVDELSVQAEVGAIALIGFSQNNVLRPAAVGRLSFNVYF